MRVDLIRLISILLCLVPERMQVRLETGSNNNLKTVDLYKQSLIEHCGVHPCNEISSILRSDAGY